MQKNQTTADLLIELGTEELPPQALRILSQAFARVAFNELKDAQLFANQDAQFNTDVQLIASPRRLGFIMQGVLDEQPEQTVERRGPSISAAFDEAGNVTKAAAGFAKSCGVEFDALDRLKTDKGEWLYYQQSQAGKPLAEILNTCLQTSIKQLPIPKRMRWGDSDVEFVRPVHWLMAMHGDAVVDIELLGLTAGATSRGHRFYCKEPIAINHTDAYFTTLSAKGKVIADFDKRRDMIAQQITTLAHEEGAQVVKDDELLEIVTALVEWPNALLGKFDERFLKMPEEVLISSMRDHQKYFHLTDKNDKLLPRFITVSNIDSEDMQRVRQGNERVLRARLSDAEFFWDNDQKVSLQSRYEKLHSVTFHHKLGSLKEKVIRISLLAEEITSQLNTDIEQARLACKLCKNDLTTEMVGEFPELQGLVGYHYALNDGVDEAVAKAVWQHYLPRFAGDILPDTPLGQALAIADRLDSIVGIFACGEIPTGDKDPYGLRRSSLGVLRIMIEKELPLDLYALINKAYENITKTIENDISSGLAKDALTKQVFEFILDRSRSYYQEQGIFNETVQAVLAIQPTQPMQLDKRLRALSEFLQQNHAQAIALASANKRIANILAKNPAPTGMVDESLLQESAEESLYQNYLNVNNSVDSAAKDQDYAKVLLHLSQLQSPLDDFFDNVMVMADEESTRDNRLRLLSHLRELFLTVADISLLRVE